MCTKYIQAAEDMNLELSMDVLDVGQNALQIWHVDAEGSRRDVSSERHVSVVAGGRVEIVYKIVDVGRGDSDFSLSFSSTYYFNIWNFNV